MKRYLLFGGAQYYPDGCDDFRKAYNDLQEAKDAGIDLLKKDDFIDWIELFDVEAEKKIFLAYYESWKREKIISRDYDGNK